jgi:hypothetical protein
MSKDQQSSQPATTPAEPPKERPAPPPYKPDEDLIGYVERGQKPPEETRER